MTYDSLTEDGRLWAVKYDDCPDMHSTCFLSSGTM